MCYIQTTKRYSALKEKGNPTLCNNTDEPGGYYVKWKKPETEGQVWHDTIYMRKLN